MTEILTESFCERCGTRYTFESARPRVRLKGVKVLSRGLKNFVLSDDTSIDEAMAAARSESDREASAHQLDAFHKTFNFCMSCRQYTCPNCWNEAEARCLSCAPLAFELAPAVDDLRELRDAVLIADASAGNGAALLEPEVEFEVAAAGPVETLNDLDGLPAPALSEPFEADLADTRDVLEAPGTDESVAGDAMSTDAALTADESVAATGDGLVEEGDAADKAASQTLGLLQRFRPGQNLDAELDAFERERGEVAADSLATDDLAALQADRIAAAARTDEPVAIEAATPAEEPAPTETAQVAEPEPATEPEPEPATEPEPVATTEPEPVPTTEPEPEPEPAPEQPTVSPIAAAAASDVVEQPTWRITAPDPTGPTQPADQGGSVPLQAAPARPSTGEPQWPAKPEWPSATAAAGLPFLGRPATPQGGIDALWAASNQELVTAPPAPGKAASGIQPCISCGLSLSATARFCRRCGTPQSR